MSPGTTERARIEDVYRRVLDEIATLARDIDRRKARLYDLQEEADELHRQLYGH